MARVLTFVLFFGLMIGVAACSGEAGPSIAVTPFDQVNTDQGESWISFNSEGDRIIFGRHEPDSWDEHTLYEMVLTDGNWSEASVLPFSGTFNDRSARFYPGVDAIIFSSDRPTGDSLVAGDFNLWTSAFDGEEWTTPMLIESLASPSNDFHASVTADGNIYFASDREIGNGASDIHVAQFGIGGYEVVEFPGPINTELSETDVYVSPDKQFVIFTRTDDPAGFGGDDLYIAWAISGGWWSAAHNLGPAVNTAEHEYGAEVAADGRTLYFTSHRDGDADIYSVSLADLNLTPPEAFVGVWF